jgi:hypothetical protein
MMPTWLTGLAAKLVGAALIIAAFAALVGVVMYEHQTALTAQGNETIAKQNQATAEGERDAAVSDAKTNAKATKQVAADGAAQLKQMASERDAAVETARLTGLMKGRIQYVPVTSQCAGSAAISDVLDSLRDNQSAGTDSGAEGKSGGPASGPVVTDVPSGPASAAEGQ